MPRNTDIDLEPPPLCPRSLRPSTFTTPPARVLLAEDDDEMREMVASALREDGYEVVEASDGGRLLVAIAEAYEDGAAAGAFDLVVSDVRMPVASGLSVLESLRKARWKTPVVLMTAFGDDATRRRAEALGAVLFDKPFDVDDLRTIALNLVAAGTAHDPQRRSLR